MLIQTIAWIIICIFVWFVPEKYSKYATFFAGLNFFIHDPIPHIDEIIILAGAFKTEFLNIYIKSKQKLLEEA